MQYDLSPWIPAAYHEGITIKNILVQKDVAMFVNAAGLFNAEIEYDFCPENLSDGDTVLPDVTQDLHTNPVLSVKNNYVIANENGIASIHAGTPRTELIDDLGLLYMCLKHRDVSSAYIAINRISNSTKNVISENLATTRIKPERDIQLVPWSL